MVTTLVKNYYLVIYVTFLQNKFIKGQASWNSDIAFSLILLTQSTKLHF